MSKVLADLDAKRREVWEAQKAVLDTAYERPLEQRSLTGEETHKVNQMDAELATLDSRIADVRAGEKRGLEGIEAIEKTVRQPADPNASSTMSFSGKTYEQEAEELRSFFSPQNRNGCRQPVFEIALPNAMERRAIMETRALGDTVQGTITTGVPLPTSFVGQLYRYLVDTSSIRQTNPTVYSTSSGEALVVPKSTSEGAATWTAEGATLVAGDPALSTVTLHAYKLAKIIQISSELLADTGFDIVGFLAESAGRNLGIAVDTAYVAGAGGTQPTGFLSGATAAFTAATGTGAPVGLPTSGAAVGADVLIELYHSILPQYRARASYVMRDSTIKVVRKLKDTTGQYLWQPALVAGQPDTILGRPVFADPNMPAISAAATQQIAFGDFAGYFIRDVTPIRFERSDDFAFGNDMISFRAIYRTDGVLGDTQAVKTYVGSAT
jgi:HK97 family phage major capsid protein